MGKTICFDSWTWANGFIALYRRENGSEPVIQGNRAAWAKREGETFYPLNEKFTSLMYFITKPTVAINSESGLEGYMIDKRS